MTESVYTVVEPIGSSPESSGKAGRTCRSLRDLRIAACRVCPVLSLEIEGSD